MTSIAELKSLLHQYISNTDDSEILEKVQKYFRELSVKKDGIIGFSIDGTPLTRELYTKEIDEARAQARAGKVITQEELEKESENW